ncbi:MAG TPA: hypothetical protein VG759_26130 [Candidatus Angelobacter sp.]|nr:hypothetical protein [Candidatus Angelobacter sp.]
MSFRTGNFSDQNTLYFLNANAKLYAGNQQEALLIAGIIIMATVTRVPQGDSMVPGGKTLIEYEEALEKLSQDEAFKATVYAMNTLLIQKGFYSAEEFRFQFRQSAQKQLRKKKSR